MPALSNQSQADGRLASRDLQGTPADPGAPREAPGISQPNRLGLTFPKADSKSSEGKRQGQADPHWASRRERPGRPGEPRAVRSSCTSPAPRLDCPSRPLTQSSHTRQIHEPSNQEPVSDRNLRPPRNAPQCQALTQRRESSWFMATAGGLAGQSSLPRGLCPSPETHRCPWTGSSHPGQACPLPEPGIQPLPEAIFCFCFCFFKFLCNRNVPSPTSVPSNTTAASYT